MTGKSYQEIAAVVGLANAESPHRHRRRRTRHRQTMAQNRLPYLSMQF